VTWKVHGYYLTNLREGITERPPTTGVLGEPVEEYDAPVSHGT
jgi:hypothetical protein